MARALVLGGSGLLGRDVAATAAARGHQVEAPSRSRLDLTDPRERLRDRIAAFRPELVFNCAALTDVDGCETRRQEALEINGHALGRLSEVLEQEGDGLLIHISTDYVFDGAADTPYRESATTGPRSVYGQSKLLGEQLLVGRRAVTVRTSWLFGLHGRSFPSAIAERAERGEDLRVVADQFGCPTFTPYLAQALVEVGERWLVERDAVPAILHYRNREPTTWYELAVRVVERFFEPSRRVRVTPVTTQEFPRPAPRPRYSVLAVDAFETLLARPVEPWLDGLEELRRARAQVAAASRRVDSAVPR